MSLGIYSRNNASTPPKVTCSNSNSGDHLWSVNVFCKNMAMELSKRRTDGRRILHTLEYTVHVQSTNERITSSTRSTRSTEPWHTWSTAVLNLEILRVLTVYVAENSETLRVHEVLVLSLKTPLLYSQLLGASEVLVLFSQNPFTLLPANGSIYVMFHEV